MVNSGDNNVSVIDTATNTVTATVNVGIQPKGVAFDPNGTKAYVTNSAYSDGYPGSTGTVSIIDTATNNVTATVNVGMYPYGIAVTSDGTKVYVVDTNYNTVSVIDTATNNVTTNVTVGNYLISIGQFIGPRPIIPTITWNNPADIVYGTPLSNVS